MPYAEISGKKHYRRADKSAVECSAGVPNPLACVQPMVEGLKQHRTTVPDGNATHADSQGEVEHLCADFALVCKQSEYDNGNHHAEYNHPCIQIYCQKSSVWKHRIYTPCQNYTTNFCVLQLYQVGRHLYRGEKTCQICTKKATLSSRHA